MHCVRWRLGRRCHICAAAPFPVCALAADRFKTQPNPKPQLSRSQSSASLFKLGAGCHSNRRSELPHSPTARANPPTPPPTGKRVATWSPPDVTVSAPAHWQFEPQGALSLSGGPSWAQAGSRARPSAGRAEGAGQSRGQPLRSSIQGHAPTGSRSLRVQRSGTEWHGSA